MLIIRKRGVTITELLVAISVMGIMFSMIIAITILTKRSYIEEENRSAMQQNTAIALSKLTRELMESSYKTTTIYNPADTGFPTGIIFASARNISDNNRFDLDPNTGQCIWHKYVCYYISTETEKVGQKALYRRETYINEPTGTTLIQPSSLGINNFITGGTGYSPSVIIAHRVEDLDFPGLPSGQLTPSQIGDKLLKISLKLGERPSGGTDPNSLRNGMIITFSMNLSN